MKKSLFTAFAVGLCITVNLWAQAPNYVPTNGLVGWWPFNGNAQDESGNGNNGTVNGATLTTDRFGNANKAYSFDGVDDYIQTDTILINNQSLSISGWINLNSYNSAGRRIIDHSWNNSGVFSTAILGSNTSSQTYFNVCFLLNNGTFCQSTIPIPTLTQYHFLEIYNNGSLSVYLNNNLVFQSNSLASISNINERILFGGGSIWTFDGTIDDIGIWNRALTPQEVSDLYNAMNCANDLTISPSINTIQTGGTANFTATTSDANSTFTWQSDFGQGYVTLNDYGNYSGTNTNTLSISNVQLVNHNQPIRAISSNTNCTDTSNIATIQIADTCITTVYDTLLTTVTDTLIINTTLSLPAPNNENTILIYPNPASDHITIDNGNFAAMAGYSIKIENNAGQQVFQSAINQAQFYIDLSTWTGNGLYFVHLIDAQNNTVTVRKIVLQ